MGAEEEAEAVAEESDEEAVSDEEEAAGGSEGPEGDEGERSDPVRLAICSSISFFCLSLKPALTPTPKEMRIGTVTLPVVIAPV